MSAALALARREFASFFRAGVGWAVLTLFLLLAGAAFAIGTLRPGAPASLRDFFALGHWLMLFIAPAVSMRSLAEETRSGTIEPLMTAPVSDWSIVLGKYLGGAAFLAVLLAPTALYAAVLLSIGGTDAAPMLAGYLGLYLLGALYLAAGTLCSALASSQAAAFLGALFLLLFLRFAAVQGGAAAPAPFDRVLYALAPELRLADFSKGVIDSAHIVFFLAVSGWLLTLAVVALASRRWR